MTKRAEPVVPTHLRLPPALHAALVASAAASGRSMNERAAELLSAALAASSA